MLKSDEFLILDFSKVETKHISNRSECLLKVGSTVTPSWFLLIKPWDSVDTVSGS